jgi:integrase
VAKTIRHTVATRLRTIRVPSDEIETLLGHRVLKKTTAVYAKYDPDYLANTRVALSTLFREVMAQADLWDAGHLRAKVGNGRTAILRRGSPEAAEFLAKRDGAGG